MRCGEDNKRQGGGKIIKGYGTIYTPEKKKKRKKRKKRKKKKQKKKKKKNSRKSVRWSAVPVPCLSRLCLKLKGKQGSGPKGVNDLCFHTYGEISPSPSPPSAYSPSNPSLEAQIPVSRPKSQLLGPNPSLEAQTLA